MTEDKTKQYGARIRLIPFRAIHPTPPNATPTSKPSSQPNFPGILNWALDGCAAWQADGLAEPPAVIAATNAYREDQDDLRQIHRRPLPPRPRPRRTHRQTSTPPTPNGPKAGGEQPLTATAFGRRLSGPAASNRWNRREKALARHPPRLRTARSSGPARFALTLAPRPCRDCAPHPAEHAGSAQD